MSATKKAECMDPRGPRYRLACGCSARIFFAWMPVPDGYTSEAFSDLLLEKANVVTAPGIGFGKHGEGYVRVGLLTSEERLREAASRIAELNIFKKTGHSH